MVFPGDVGLGGLDKLLERVARIVFQLA